MRGRAMTGSVLPNLLLLLLLLGLVGLHWFVLPDPSRRNHEFLPDMVTSPAHDAQAPLPVLAGGLSLDLRPPPGAIARGYRPLGYDATPEDARRAGVELANPVAVDDADAVARGAFVYNNFCAVCHGLGGLGDGPVTTRGVPPPPSLLADNARQMSDGRMFHLISLGQGNMSSYAAQVERDDRWKVILYIRTLQEASQTP